tara:strand:+ start:189102 stop:189821 length:720 start_codon:yes stop_codon:yes gene_type:complete
MFILGSALMGTSSWAASDQTTNTRSVFELFTAEGCPYCPPADKALNGFAQNPQIIALSCHVTYWDHLSSDSLARQFCTDRQLHYSVNGGDKRRVYTPELVINGKLSLVGSETQSIQEALKGSITIPENIDLKLWGDNRLDIMLPNISGLSENNVVTLITYGDDLETKIARGKNKGQTNHYTNPIIAIDYLSNDWDGAAHSLAVRVNNKSYNHPVKGYVVFVHKGPSHVGPIIAVGKLEL